MASLKIHQADTPSPGRQELFNTMRNENPALFIVFAV